MAEKEFLQELLEYLCNTYPQDIDIKQWFLKHSEKLGHNKQVLKRTRSVVKQEVENKLLESYSGARQISGEIKIHVETIDSCVQSIQLLELAIKSNKRDIIYQICFTRRSNKPFKNDKKRKYRCLFSTLRN